ncbi:unnamed protein product [Hydatigera taeniaeformis]|uniref:GTD-binding domain-containing protein n=1 Tax=Hydatigena taeniaeformis TaxID=6205 RepID=A0A0R3XDD3_HYDTA|nr:unnamed protein product [Hydatigera taeniaeformis]
MAVIKCLSTLVPSAMALCLPKGRTKACSEEDKISERLLAILLSFFALLNSIAMFCIIQFSNQLAHERALLELLELEHNRVRSEVKIAERKCSTAPSDLVNQLRHLKERLEQQKTLIDDLEYQYLEVSATCQLVELSDIESFAFFLAIP